MLTLALALLACNDAATPSNPPQPAAEKVESSEKKAAPAQAAAPAPPQAAITMDTPPDVAAPPKDAQVTASGLASRVLKPGQGTEHPDAAARVTVHYSGWTTDGKLFDSSLKRGRPATFPLQGVIPGWTEGLQLMTKGEVRRFWIPEELAYKGKPGRPQGMLVFDVQLLDFQNPIPAPPDVAAPPPDAEVTASGLASRVLVPGDGPRPGPHAKVKVNYTGWTTDGKMFDSSSLHGGPAALPLDRVIPGWSEGLQLMQVGEKRRLWIPEELAYKGRPGAPQGMLVFDVELLEIVQPG